MNSLEPDREMLGQFALLMFKHARHDGFVSLRAFPDKKTQKKDKPIFIDPIRIDDVDFLATTTERARQAAAWHEPAVFCPPVVTFRNHTNAKTENIFEGVCLSVECDQNPHTARATLEALLGTTTAVVASGGEWINPQTGEIEPKVHLYWRLKKPTFTKLEHDLLKEARALATILVGGDDTNISIVHPIRWPGSWHRKGTPRLAETVAFSDDNEIDLAEAVERLRDAAGALDFSKAGVEANGKLEAADHAAVAAALAVIPNDELEWADWNRIGMATWAATGGSEIGHKAFAEWSAKSAKNDPGTTEARWQRYTTAPPTQIGFGTLIYLARRHSPGWRCGSASDGVVLDDFYAYMPRHLYIFVHREMWPGTSVNSRLPKVPLKKRDGTPVVDEKGNPKYTSPSVWLDKHRPVEQMTWSPSEPPTVEDRLMAEGGWFERTGATTFNLYRPPTVRQGNSANADRWIELVERIYPADASHIIAYCAHRIQYPAVKINHGVLLGGSTGIGKDSMLEPLKIGVGPWNFREVTPHDIMSNYNDYMQCVVLRISEAHDLGDINRYTLHDHMKTILATPPDVIRVNGKYIPQHYVLNVAGVFYTTNHHFDSVYLPPNDRRTYVAWSEVVSEEFTKGFWPNFWGWYAGGGLEDVVAYLAEYDLSKFDPKAPPKKTDAFWQIVGAGAAPENSELADALDKLGAKEGAKDADGTPCGPVVTTLAKLRDAASADLDEWLNDRKNRRVMSHRFEACGYRTVLNPDAKDGLWVIKGRRQMVYGRMNVHPDELVKAARGLT